VTSCPNCGEENPERARFCLACGHELAVGVQAGEERKVVSVLFVDLVGFTSGADGADPEDVRATLRPYHERVKADLERFGGTVEKFIGDAVMAVFGAPVAHEDDAERAVRSALRILETIEELREEGLDLAVRAAVTTGETVVALGARPERGEGIVTGDVVNTAARLQSAAPVGGVLVDETTMRSTTAAIRYEDHAPVDAKGKAAAIPAWRAREARSRIGQPETATVTPFVGREHERTLLIETFMRAERESSVQLVTIVGEPGIGKSRLVTELRTTLDERPDMTTWRHGRCLPYGEGITFWALGEIVKAEAGILESDDQQEAASKLDGMLADLFPDAGEHAWFHARLGPLVGVGEDSGAASREESFTAWRRFLEELAARHACVLVLEDLHWADAALLEFVEHLVDWSTPVPLLLLCTARPELFERRSSWGGGKRNATTISLSPLSTEESGRLLQLLLDRTLLPAETQSALLERAGGNPLYAEQFARMLQERGSIEGLAVPESVQALMTARMDTLRPELKALLHDAAVVGRIFWSGALAAMGDRDPATVRGDLNELVHREFVRPVRVASIDGEQEFSFWHALVRDVAYGQIPRGPRADKHVAVAAWIERTAGERVEDHAEILVHHYGEALGLASAAGDARPGLESDLARFLVLAGDRAMHLDVEAAETHYRRALALLQSDERARAVVLTKLAEALVIRGDSEEAIASYESAAASLQGRDHRAAGGAMWALSRALWGRGRVDEANELGDRALALLERYPGAELVAAYGSSAHRAAIGGRSEAASVLAEKGLALADELGVADVVAHLQARATIRGYAGDPRCLEDAREAKELGLRLGLGRGTAVAMNNYAESLYYFESAGAGRAEWDEAIAFARARGLTGAEVWFRCERLRALLHMGAWDELGSEAGEVGRWMDAHGWAGGQAEVIARIQVADMLVHRGALTEATAEADTLVPNARASGDPQVLVPGLTVAAVVASARGELEQARAHVIELEELTRDSPAWRGYCLAWPARIAAAAGRPELIDAFLSGANEAPGWNTCARRSALAVLAETRGRVEEAATFYREAIDAWTAWGSLVERGYALLGVGRLGDASALREGQSIFAGLGAAPVAARAA
jgi:class 3 adenylate cyclase/tetratricopeptide (TPR) repeat protein